jgi:hypothetical protein
MTVQWTRIGPVYLYFSERENSGAEVIGWGGDDIYYCRACPAFEVYSQGEAVAHAATHGLVVTP